jgi:hypothetical protein
VFALAAVKLVPRSIDHSSQASAGDCNASLDAGVPMAIAADSSGKVDVTYSYTVNFVIDNNIKWSSRFVKRLESPVLKNELRRTKL